jgi:UDP-glucose 4-epimerase
VGLTRTPEHFGPLLPISMYGASKLGAEGVISAFCGMFGVQSWIFRFANVVGKRQTHGVGFDFVRKLKKDATHLDILGDGTQSKSYVHVSDVIAAILFCVDKCHDQVNVFNVATEDYVSVAEIAEIAVRKMGLRNVEFRYSGGDRGWKGDVPKVRFDLTKIHRLGWSAKYTAKAALELSVVQLLEDLS